MIKDSTHTQELRNDISSLTESDSLYAYGIRFLRRDTATVYSGWVRDDNNEQVKVFCAVRQRKVDGNVVKSIGVAVTEKHLDVKNPRPYRKFV